LRLLSQNDNNGATNGAGTNKSNDDKTSASVQDFFAKAVSSGDGPSAFTSIPLVTQPPLPITVMPISQGLAHGMVPVGGYHLLGGPQQQPPAPPATTGTSGINPMVQRLMSNPGIHSVDAIEAEQRKSASPNQEQQVVMTPKTKNISDLESDLKKKLHIGSSSLLNNNNDKTFAPVQLDQDRVKLLSPQAFSRPAASPSPPAAAANGASPPAGQISPLTGDQLVEAMTFLLETDQDFVHKLHQAYVMALNRKLTAMK